MKPEEAGWLPAAACCIVALLAWLTFAFTTSVGIAKTLTWLRLRLRSFRRRSGLLLARGEETDLNRNGGNIE